MRVESRPAVAGMTSAGATAAGAPAARRPGDGPRFSLGLDVPARPEAAPSRVHTAALASLDAVLLLQAEEHDPAERRRRGARRGRSLLDALDALRASLLAGRAPTAELGALSARLADLSEASGDPRLDGLLAEIELRAAVEIAKMEIASSGGIREPI